MLVLLIRHDALLSAERVALRVLGLYDVILHGLPGLTAADGRPGRSR